MSVDEDVLERLKAVAQDTIDRVRHGSYDAHSRKAQICKIVCEHMDAVYSDDDYRRDLDSLEHTRTVALQHGLVHLGQLAVWAYYRDRRAAPPASTVEAIRAEAALMLEVCDAGLAEVGLRLLTSDAPIWECLRQALGEDHAGVKLAVK